MWKNHAHSSLRERRSDTGGIVSASGRYCAEVSATHAGRAADDLGPQGSGRGGGLSLSPRWRPTTATTTPPNTRASKCSPKRARSGRPSRFLTSLVTPLRPTSRRRTIHSDGTVIPLDRQSGRSAGRKDHQLPCQGLGLQPAQRRSGQHSGVQVDRAIDRWKRRRRS